MDIENPITQSIAEQLRERIAGKKIQMKDIASETGIAVVSLSRYVNGKRDIPASSFALICKAINLDGGEVLRNSIEKFTAIKAEGNA